MAATFSDECVFSLLHVLCDTGNSSLRDFKNNFQLLQTEGGFLGIILKKKFQM